MPATNLVAENFVAIKTENGYEAIENTGYVATVTNDSGRADAYTTLGEALEAAQDGDTVTLLEDIKIDTAATGHPEESTHVGLYISQKSLTIEGNGKTISSSAVGRVFQVIGDYDADGTVDCGMITVTLKDLTIISTGNSFRPLETRGGNITLNLENVVLDNTGSSGSNNIVFTVGGNSTCGSSALPVYVNISDSMLTAMETGFAFKSFNPVTLSIKDGSELSGYGVLWFDGQHSSFGSRGSVVTVEDSTLTGNNSQSDSSSNFAVIVIDESNVSVTLIDSSVNVNASGTADNAVVLPRYAAQNVTLSIEGDSTVTLNGDTAIHYAEAAVAGLDSFQYTLGAGVKTNVLTTDLAADSIIYYDEAEDVYVVVKEENAAEAGIVAKIGDVGYTTLQAAIDAANGDEVITLVKDIVLDSSNSYSSGVGIYIGKSVTIDGAGKYSVSTATIRKLFEVHGSQDNSNPFTVTFRDIELINTTNIKNSRVVDIRDGNIVLNLEEAVLDMKDASGINVQPLTIGGNSTGMNGPVVNITGGGVHANGSGYAIIVFNPVHLTISNAAISGWAGLYFKGQEDSAGSAGSIVKVTGGTVTVGSNQYSGGQNDFGVVTFESGGIDLTISGSAITANAEGASGQAILLFSSYTSADAEKNTISVTDTKMEVNGAAAEFVRDNTTGGDNSVEVAGGTANFPIESKYLAGGYTLSKDEDGNYVVSEQAAVAEIVRGEKTYSFADLATAFAEAEDEDTIKLLSDEAVIDGETGRILIEKRVIFDLNGYTLTIGAGLGNTVALNVRANGDLTLKDSSENQTGTIDATEADKDVNEGTVPVGTMQAGAKLTVLSGTIIVDTDSESCVFGMAGTTISIEGGTFINLADTPYVHGGGTPLTVNIDKNASDASAILQVTGGTFIGRNPALGDDSVKTGNFIPDTVKLTLTYNEQGEAVYTVLDADAEVPEGTPAVYSVESGAVVATVYTAEGLEEALAEGYATVYLGADITANISVPAGRTLTLDLAGHTLTSNVENVATIYNEGDLTITSSSRGGAVTREATEADGTESTYYVIRNEGKMTLESSYLTVYNDNAADPSSVIGNNTGCRNSNPASLTIADGTYRSQASNAVKNDEYGILTITGGTFRTYSQNHAAVQNWATATISGGTFYGVRFALSVEVYNGQTNTTTIMGGTFRDADNAIFISDGYRDGSAVYEGGTIDLSVGGSAKIRGPITESEEFPISDGDDTLSVTVAPDDGFIVGSTEMLAQALNVNDTQIVLGAGLTYNFEVAAGKTFTLDLAGHTLTSDTANVATVTNYGDLTIIDSVGGGMITRGSSHYYVIVNEGTMTLDGITVENRSSSDVSSLIINNADLNSEDAAQLTILSGTYYSNRASNTVKNDEYGILYIRGGEFTSTSSNAQSAVLNWGYAEVSGDPVFQGNKIAFVAGAVKDQTGTTIISGGTFRTTNIAISGGAGALVLMVGDGSGSGAGMRNVTITGGNFEGTFKSIYYLNSSSSAITADTLTITGGHFTAPIEVRSEMKMSVTGGTFESTLSTGGQTEYISGGAFAREPAETAFAQDYAGVLYNGYYVVIETTTDDLGALIVARVNAQGDVRNYAASLDLIWADIQALAEDADSAFSSAAAAVIEAYDDIAYATSEGAVALARLSAMDALDTLLAQIRAEEEAAAEVLVAAKADAISQIDAAKAASEDQAAVVVPTATYLAINSAETVEEVAQYLENALAEIKDIRTYRAEIGGQTSALSDLAQQLEAITGEGGEFDSLLSEIKTAVSFHKQSFGSCFRIMLHFLCEFR